MSRTSSAASHVGFYRQPYTAPVDNVSVERSRSRSRKKCFWEESETQLLIEVLQDMACDPSWKTDTGFRSNYLCEVHRRILVKRPSFSKKVSPHIESKVKWLKTKFHAINDMLKQSGCSWNDIDKKIACERDWYVSYFAEGYEDAIHNLEVEQNVENGGENLVEFQFSLSDEENDVHYMSHATQTASNLNNATKMANKQKTSTIGGKAAKKRKTRDMETQLEGINHSFQTFVEGFNANFGTMANAVANAMTEDNMRKKAESEKLKDVLDELMKLDIPSGDVLHAGEIFAANKDKMDLFMNLSKPLRLSYVLKLMGLSSRTEPLSVIKTAIIAPWEADRYTISSSFDLGATSRGSSEKCCFSCLKACFASGVQ
ncbi:Myb/SANT-like domain-containing protein [Tanacetum coccineum]